MDACEAVELELDVAGKGAAGQHAGEGELVVGRSGGGGGTKIHLEGAASGQIHGAVPSKLAHGSCRCESAGGENGGVTAGGNRAADGPVATEGGSGDTDRTGCGGAVAIDQQRAGGDRGVAGVGVRAGEDPGAGRVASSKNDTRASKKQGYVDS